MDNDNIFEERKGDYNQQKDFTSLICWKDARKMKLYFMSIGKVTEKYTILKETIMT